MSDERPNRDRVEQGVAEPIAAWYAQPLPIDAAHRERVIAVALAKRSRSRRWPRTVPWIAAACAAALVLAALLGRSRTRGASVAPVPVRFVLRGVTTAERVTLVGDFNGWNVNATPLGRVSSGAVWAVDVPVPPGRYGYAFVIDGRQWVADPAAPLAPDGFGKPMSVVVVE